MMRTATLAPARESARARSVRLGAVDLCADPPRRRRSLRGPTAAAAISARTHRGGVALGDSQNSLRFWASDHGE